MALLALAACGSPTDSDPSPQHLLQTDRDAYELRRTDDRARVDIGFTFTNSTGESLFVLQCNGLSHLVLEKRSFPGAPWKLAWEPTLPSCLGIPLEIEAGATFSGSLQVSAGNPGSNSFPQFLVNPIPGTYRLVWHALRRTFDPSGPPFGEPVALPVRVSNEFRLTVP